jgi:PAS domain-containing protein
MRDAEGRVVGLVGVSIDITAQKRAEQELRDLNETLEDRVADRTRERDRAWKLSQDFLLVADPDNRIEAVSPAWETQLGWPQEVLIGANFLDFVHRLCPRMDGRTRQVATSPPSDSGKRRWPKPKTTCGRLRRWKRSAS